MIEDGKSADDVKSFLAASLKSGNEKLFGDSAQCEEAASAQCNAKYDQDTPAWYACYAGAFAGCMSA